MVSGSNDDAAGDAKGVQGGTTMEVSGHPMIYSATMAQAVAEAYIQVFGAPRKKKVQEMAWLDAGSIAPWLLLNPLPTVVINNEKTAWLVTGIDHNEHTGKAELTMVEILEPLYGQDYGMGLI